MAFLVFEGIDASGKSTLLNLLCEKLKQQNLNFLQTREPGGTTIGKKIRRFLLEKNSFPIDPVTETLLYYSDRKQHIEEKIKPALKKGFWIVSDRYYASTEAYQCGGRGVTKNFIQYLQEKICGAIEPDLWILLDLPVNIALQRLSNRKSKSDRLESQNKVFYQKVRQYYLKLAKKRTEKWLVLSAITPPKVLLDKLLSELKYKGFLNVG